MTNDNDNTTTNPARIHEALKMIAAHLSTLAGGTVRLGYIGNVGPAILTPTGEAPRYRYDDRSWHFSHPEPNPRGTTNAAGFDVSGESNTIGGGTPAELLASVTTSGGLERFERWAAGTLNDPAYRERLRVAREARKATPEFAAKRAAAKARREARAEAIRRGFEWSDERLSK